MDESKPTVTSVPEPMDAAKRAELVQRYERACHAVQTGVATEIGARGPIEAAADPKHLRTGVNSALVDSSALANLLMAKGVITEEEYLTAIAAGMEAEAKRYEERLSRKLGRKVTLG